MKPRATLRLQLHAGFTFDDAAAHVGYFARLGVSHLYLSPITAAEPGSRHGYDVVDYSTVNPELGGEAAFVRLIDALRRRGMGAIVDIVPNHMGVGGSSNRWWNDVLEWGARSRFARHFDIDWHASDPALQRKVLLPCLGRPYGEALAAGDIALRADAAHGRFAIACAGRTLPVQIGAYPDILRAANRSDLNALAERFDAPGARPSNHARLDAAHAALRDYAAARGPGALDAVLHGFDPRIARSREMLHRLLEQQHYRLAWWRTATDEINWRRFFDISTLACMRIEDAAVFDDVHALLWRLYAAGLVDGVRIDHVDGLADPRGYCRQLRGRLAALRDGEPYIVVEKILAPDERLPEDWRVDGTTGYDFMNDVSALLHDAAGAAPLAALWADMTGAETTFAREALDGKRRVLARQFAAEHERVARAMHRLARASRDARDFALNPIRRAVAELAIRLPVYRLYPSAGAPQRTDRALLAGAWQAARSAIAPADRAALDYVAATLGLPGVARAVAGLGDPARLAARVGFAQLTAPLAAKGVEDTACYRYGRLLSRNEVGAHADALSLAPGAFHTRNRRRRRTFPGALLATATHDHKRGEDARARLAVLSEAHRAWRAAALDWAAFNAPHRHGAPAAADRIPGPAAEAMLYQTLVGAWPPALAPDDAPGLAALTDRVERWQLKALREAKRGTDWLEPNLGYEAGCAAFLRAIMTPHGPDDFAHRLHRLVARIAPAGIVNSLSQAALRLLSPGVPDLYQGAQTWDHTLVDPDNRADVPFARYAAQRIDAPVAAYLRDWADGRVKHALIGRLLALRAAHPETFAAGAYVPLHMRGTRRGHALAFARRDASTTIVVIATRLAYPLLGDAPARPCVEAACWADTAVGLAPGFAGPWRDVLNDGTLDAPSGMLPLAAALAHLPVAVLIREGGAADTPRRGA